MKPLTPADRELAAGIAAAHPLTVHAIRAKGNHLAAANDEPEPEEFAPMTEAQYLEADRARNVDKGDRAADADFSEAMRLQMRMQGINDVIGGR